jgi:hypothetical protein
MLARHEQEPLISNPIESSFTQDVKYLKKHIQELLKVLQRTQE